MLETPTFNWEAVASGLGTGWTPWWDPVSSAEGAVSAGVWEEPALQAEPVLRAAPGSCECKLS